MADMAIDGVTADEVTVTLPAVAVWGTRITVPTGVWEYHHRGWRRVDEQAVSGKSAEQQARDLLEQCGVEDAQSFTAGDVIALANLIAEAEEHRQQLAAIRERCVGFTPDPSVVDEILEILDGGFRPSEVKP